ncbi:MAG: hypothetical protein HYW25_00280 [Candidatus Aenigmarchaeota archaeon]|nr:hypothetical protein [Candidatus Aenigmarchaeota archaeon]
MKKKSTAVAFPTIPVVFVGGIRENRRPMYNTVGMAVTDEFESIRTETTVEVRPKEYGINFLFEGKPLGGDRGRDILMAVKEFLKRADLDIGLHIESRNFSISSGSSDAGMAALVAALNDATQADMHLHDLAQIAMIGSESAIRSVYGGMNEIVVDPHPDLYGVQILSDKDLESIRLLAVTFNYPSRITADEIHAAIRTHPWFRNRVEHVNHYWIPRIRAAAHNKDLKQLFELAEENIRNAHYLLEEVGLRVRKKPIMNCWLDVEELRSQGLFAYCLQGGGNVVYIATLKEQLSQVQRELQGKGWQSQICKVASGPKIVRSE